MKKKRILFFCSFPPPFTGQTLATKRIYNELKKELDCSKIDATSINSTNILKKLFNWVKVLYKLWRVKNNYDIIYLVYSGSVLGCIRDLAIVLLVRDKIIVSHIHNGSYNILFENIFTKYVVSIINRLTYRYIYLSESLYLKSNNYIENSKVAIIPNTIDPEILVNSEEVNNKIKEKCKNRDSFEIIFISNFITSKGYIDLANSIKYIQDKTKKKIVLRLVGSWIYPQDKEFFSRKYSIEIDKDEIIIHGPEFERSKIKEMLLNADLFALPTYYPTEAQPLSILEAMNAGLPIISTNHASIPDFVLHDVNGYLVEKKNPLDLGKYILLLTENNNWKSKAFSSRRIFEDLFSPKIINKNLIKFFCNL